MTPQQLDNQSPVKIDEWVVVDSPRFRQLDTTPAFTHKVIKLGFEDKWMYADSSGRLFCRFENQPHTPFHFDVDGKLYGYVMPEKAAN